MASPLPLLSDTGFDWCLAFKAFENRTQGRSAPSAVGRWRPGSYARRLSTLSEARVVELAVELCLRVREST